MEEKNIETSEDESSDDDDDNEKKKPGRPPKSWSKSGYDSKKRKTDELLDYIRETATKLGISFHDLISFLVKREANVTGDLELSDLFKGLNR